MDPYSSKNRFFFQNFALNKVAQLQIWFQILPLIWLSGQVLLKKWMIFGLRSNFPCAAKFKDHLLFGKIFRGKSSKIAGSKLQLVLFDTFYTTNWPQKTLFWFYIRIGLNCTWPPAHLSTCPPETPEKHVSTYRKVASINGR